MIVRDPEGAPEGTPDEAQGQPENTEKTPAEPSQGGE